MDTRDLRPEELVYSPPKADEPPMPGGSLDPRPKAVFFAVSPLKLVVMSVATFGLYEMFWLYANWQRIRRREGTRISPFWRSVFGYFFIASLFSSVRKTAIGAGIPVTFNGGLLAMGWIALTLMWRLPDPFWLISVAAVVFLLPVQKTMNQINDALTPGHDPNTRFSAGNVVGIVVGGIVLCLAIVGSVLPA